MVTGWGWPPGGRGTCGPTSTPSPKVGSLVAPPLLTSVTLVTSQEGRAFEQGLQRRREADRNCSAIRMNSLRPCASTCGHSITQKWSRGFYTSQGTSAHSQGVGTLGTQSLLNGKILHGIPSTAISTACWTVTAPDQCVGFQQWVVGPLGT